MLQLRHLNLQATTLWGEGREAGKGVSVWPAKFKALQEQDCGSHG